MQFLISPQQEELAAAVRRYFADTHGAETLRRLDKSSNRDPIIWQGLVDMGLTGLLIPEAVGGMGLGLLDATLVARECGRVALAEPLVDTAFVAVPWLAARGETSDFPDILIGKCHIALAHIINEWVADAAEGADGDVTRTSGVDVVLNNFTVNKDIIAEENPAFSTYERDISAISACDSLDTIDPLRNLTRLPTGTSGLSQDPLLLDLGALMSAAQLVGLAEAMFDQTIAYAKIRKQFGQPIGGFQAIKHRLATIAVALEFARVVLWRAAAAMEERLNPMPNDPMISAALYVSHAKIAASDVAYRTAENAIQIYGAMGYTYEVDLHYWMKRTWALSGAWGSRDFHYSRVDSAVLGGQHPLGPQHSFA